MEHVKRNFCESVSDPSRGIFGISRKAQDGKFQLGQFCSFSDDEEQALLQKALGNFRDNVLFFALKSRLLGKPLFTLDELERLSNEEKHTLNMKYVVAMERKFSVSYSSSASSQVIT